MLASRAAATSTQPSTGGEAPSRGSRSKTPDSSTPEAGSRPASGAQAWQRASTRGYSLSPTVICGESVAAEALGGSLVRTSMVRRGRSLDKDPDRADLLDAFT